MTKWTKDKIGFNTDGSKIKLSKAEQNKFPQKKKTSKVDEKYEYMSEIVEFLIKYLLKMRSFTYVC